MIIKNDYFIYIIYIYYFAIHLMSSEPFDFEWFIDAYNLANSPNTACMLPEIMKNKIDEAYATHCLNYEQFVNDISLHLSLSNEEKKQYLTQIKYCILCKCNYPCSHELFVHCLDYFTHINITDQLCEPCIKQYKCNNCCMGFADEPYETVYFDQTPCHYLCPRCAAML